MSKCKIVKNSIQFQQITIAVIDAYHNKQLLRDMHQNVSEEEKELAWSRFLLCSRQVAGLSVSGLKLLLCACCTRRMRYTFLFTYTVAILLLHEWLVIGSHWSSKACMGSPHLRGHQTHKRIFSAGADSSHFGMGGTDPTLQPPNPKFYLHNV